MIKKIPSTFILNKHLIILMFIAAFIKALQLFGIPVLFETETQEYIDSAISLLTFDKNTFGLRLPVYPLFIHFLFKIFQSYFVIILFQQLFSFISIFFVYKIGQLFFNNKWSLFLAIAYLLCPISIYNSFLLTESLSLSLFSIFLYYFLKQFLFPKFSYSLIVSITISLLILTRPQFISLLICFVILFYRSKNNFKLYFTYFVTIFVISAWIIIVTNVTGHITVTNLIGFNLMTHTGKFIDNAPDEYLTIKHEYSKKRDLNLENKGNQVYTIFEIGDTLKNKLNINKVELSHTLKILSYKLIISYPFEYLKSVWAALKLSLIIPSFDIKEKSFTIFFFRFFIPFFQLLIGFGITVGVLFSTFSKNRIYVLLIGLIFINLLSSILFDCADNSRYFIYSYLIILVFVFIGIKIILENRHKISYSVSRQN